MTDLPPDGAALFAGVLDSPRDPVRKGVLADWLDDHGEPVLAHGFRWCAAYGRHPGLGFDAGPGHGKAATAWMVLARGKLPTPRTDRNRLPWAVAMHFAHKHGAAGLRGWYGPQDRSWPTPWAAFAALADALETLAAVVRLPAH